MVLEPLIKTIDVSCNKEMAFRVFINEMDSWWPLGKFTTSAMAGQPAKSIRIDAKTGGEIVEIGPDNSETLWGTFIAYEPSDLLIMTFHIPRPGEEVNDRSRVEVRFTEKSAGETRVELTQSNWEAFGKRAKELRGGYGPGWSMLLAAYKVSCEPNV